MDHKSALGNVLVSSAIAGFGTGYVVNIIEVVKSTILSKITVSETNAKQPKQKRSAIFGTLSEIVKTKGVTGLLRGSFSQALASSIRGSFQLLLYEYNLRGLKRYVAKNSEIFGFLTPWIPGIAAMGAKLISTPLSIHFEQISTRRQIGQPGRPFHFSFDGLGYTLGREVLFSAVFWTANERLFLFLKQNYGTVTATGYSALLSGLIAGGVTYPFDALRTWKMLYPELVKNSGKLALFREFFRTQGVSYFLSGLLLRMTRSSVANSVFFTFYASIIKKVEVFKVDPNAK